jgi:hypothetical protein
MVTNRIKGADARKGVSVNNGRRHRLSKRTVLVLLAILVPLIGGTACARMSYSLLDIDPDSVEVPDGYYQDVAWLESQLLAMEYMSSPDTHNLKTRLMILNMDSGDNHLLPDEISSNCQETRYGRINRLPNELLGYLWECIPHLGIARDFRLHQWDQTKEVDQELYRYPVPFYPTAFSFAKEMGQWLQEETGDGLFNKLHYVEPKMEPVRLLESNFARAGHPAWLPDGQIIFAGTPTLPESKTNLFSGMPGITSTLQQPWNIYLTDLNSLLSGDVGKDQILLSGIQYIEAVKTSPDGQYVSFLGTIDGNQGLWIYRLESRELARLWAGFGPYDWSPDGKRIIVLVRDPDAGIFRGQPAQIELPETLSE